MESLESVIYFYLSFYFFLGVQIHHGVIFVLSIDHSRYIVAWFHRHSVVLAKQWSISVWAHYSNELLRTHWSFMYIVRYLREIGSGTLCFLSDTYLFRIQFCQPQNLLIIFESLDTSRTLRTSNPSRNIQSLPLKTPVDHLSFYIYNPYIKT